MGNYRHNLSKRVRQILNIGMEEFCKKYLDTEVKAFQYRMRNRSCYPNEIIYISWLLGEGVEDLFGTEFTEMMMTDGPEFVTKKIKAMFKEADESKRSDYLKFIGVKKNDLILSSEEVKEVIQEAPEKGVQVQEEKQEPKQNGSVHDVLKKKLVSFFEDVVVHR